MKRSYALAAFVSTTYYQFFTNNLKYSKIVEIIKKGSTGVILGGAAKAGSDLYDYTKDKVTGVLEEFNKSSGDSSNTNTSNESNTNSK